MAIEYNMYKKDTLPATLESNSIYITAGPNSDEANITITGTTASVIRSVISHAQVDDKINAAVSANENMLAVADIAARNALTLSRNGMVLVTDASADVKVTAGSAVYFYTLVSDTYEKIYEFEGIDLTLEWANIENRPTSTVTNIDDAVTKRHNHVETEADIDTVTNALIGNAATTLKDVGTDGTTGDLTYNNKRLGATYFSGTPDW